IASDSIMTNVDLNGQSLVEAGVDDLFVWDLAPVGISEIALDREISIYPNPANDKLVMQISSAISKASTVQVVNALGEIVFDSPVGADQKQFILPVKNLEEGFYTLNFITEQGTVRKKFMIQH
ncbi:MAG: T9SS type A sorting domain-containing protein, partial [Chitinophagales bacterium]